MEFRTKISPLPFKHLIDYSQFGFCVGSCFAQNIAHKMEQAKLPIASNPFGVLYNPASIANGLDALACGSRFTAADIVLQSDVWCNFSFHGSFSDIDAGVALDKMNRSVEKGAIALQKSDYVVITFGSAWVYELAQDFESVSAGGARYSGPMLGSVVANCHKFPASVFRRRRLSVEEIVERYDTLLEGMLSGKRVIMTVSPVRHLRDGAHENTVSKSTLILAIDALSKRHPNVEYFPSFEILNDDLRDYRFYGDDMVHPSKAAVDYIWERFCDAALTQAAIETTRDMERITAAARHRPINPNTDSHAEFMRSMLEKTLSLKERYPMVDLSDELSFFATPI